MSVVVILRAAPIATTAELAHPETVRHHEMFERGALKPRPGLDLGDIPILVDHVKDDTPIGRVTSLRTDECWTGGTWLWVHAHIDDPPPWLSKESAVSIGRSAYSTRDLGAGWDLVCRAFLNEVSILSPGVKPAFARARVEWIGKPEPRPNEPKLAVRQGSGVLTRHRRDDEEMDELRRRVDWYEQRGLDVEMGLIIQNMKDEIAGRASLGRMGRHYGAVR